MMRHQRGVGLIEVLVSLFILAIAVLGFSVLQVRALDASAEAAERTNAIMIARDLAERIRVNRTQLGNYKTTVNNALGRTARPGNAKCVLTDSRNTTIAVTTMCTQGELVTQDVKEVLIQADQRGFQMVIADCQGGTRQCIYIAWGDTTLTATNVNACMRNGVYQNAARCFVMEAY